ncbi:hypothetical protein ACFE04_007948 [Oxalis oulophora]
MENSSNSNSVEERLLVDSTEIENTNGTSDLKKRIWEESKLTWRIAFPGVISRVTSFGTIVITQLFLGHIGEVHLAAYALVQTLFIRFVNGILIGMSSATETLCGQAFGAGHHHMMGIYLQRSWIVNFVTATLFVPVFVFAAPILKAIGQDPTIAETARQLSLWFIPFLYYFVFAFTTQMYLQSQLKNIIIAWLSLVSLGILVLLSWIFVYVVHWSVNGAMFSLNIASWFVNFGMLIYVFGGWCPNTWKGFSTAAFKDLWPVIKLSISSGIMLCLELWYNSILVLLAGYMKNATVAIDAFSICLNINAWELMISLGFFTATSVRVSNELGKGNGKAAKFAVKVILCTNSMIGIFFCVLCLAFGREISYMFTSSEEVANYVSKLAYLLAINILLNSIQPVLSGVAVGAGFQSKVAYVNLGCYYGIGIPVGALLAYVAGLEVLGLWIGMLIGVVVQTMVLAFIVWRLDWDNEVKKTSERLDQWLVKPSDEANENNFAT